MSRIRVLIADDHALVRTGLRALLEAQSDIEVVGEAEDGVVAWESCRRLRPEVVVMDLKLPGRGGISATEDIRRECPDTQVVVLTMHDDEAYVRMARLAGAAGFVLKKALATELILAIRTAHAGRSHFPPTEPGPVTRTARARCRYTARQQNPDRRTYATESLQSQITGASALAPSRCSARG
jgi:two-component system response regulator NreC